MDGSVTGLDVTSAVLTIEDDDERGVTVTPTSLTVPEGRERDLHGGSDLAADGFEVTVTLSRDREPGCDAVAVATDVHGRRPGRYGADGDGVCGGGYRTL